MSESKAQININVWSSPATEACTGTQCDVSFASSCKGSMQCFVIVLFKILEQYIVGVFAKSLDFSWRKQSVLLFSGCRNPS